MLADRLEEWALDYKAKGVLQGMQQGMQKGMQKGERKGKQEGEALALQRLLTKRFGELPVQLSARINEADLVQIEQWLDRIFDAKNIDDIFSDAIKH